jgi:hypothetical protein
MLTMETSCRSKEGNLKTLSGFLKGWSLRNPATHHRIVNFKGKMVSQAANMRLLAAENSVIFILFNFTFTDLTVHFQPTCDVGNAVTLDGGTEGDRGTRVSGGAL